MTSLIYLAIISVIWMLDRVTKLWAQSTLSRSIVVIPRVLQFTYAQNPGASFGILQGERWLLTILPLIVTLALIAFMIIRRDKISNAIKTGCALIIAGGLGNMVDRIATGYVIDFIYIKLINFPIFNIADISLTVGCAVLLIAVAFGKERKQQDEAD